MGFELKLVSETERINYIKENYDLNLLIFMGDSDVDAQVFNFVKFGIAPDNARPEAKKTQATLLMFQVEKELLQRPVIG